MKKQHLKKFETQADYEAQKNEILGRPNVALVDDDVKYDIPSINVTIGKYRVSTFYYDYPVEIPQGISAQIIIDIIDDNGKVKAMGKEIYGSIPPYTGVVLLLKEGVEPNTFKMFYNPNNLADVSGNLLRGTTVTTYVEGPACVLSVQNNEIGFY